MLILIDIMPTKLFGVVSGPHFKEVKSPSSAYGIELRLDTFPDFKLQDVRDFLKKAKMPVMLTLRRKDQGGEYQGSDEERLKLIETLCALKPEYVDLEYDVPTEFKKRLFETFPDILFISSYHDFSGMPEDLESIYDQVKTPFAHICKIAVTAQSTTDALKMLLFVKKHSENNQLIGICMGEKGEASRILAPLAHNYLTYASLEKSSAPGQLSADTLQNIYNFSKLNPQTQIFALIGSPVSKSLGHIIHNAVFREMNLNAVYIKLDLDTQDLPSFFYLAHQFPFHGISITMPHKENVLSFCHSTSQVQSIGSCNTLTLTSNHFVGYNTDGVGALNAIEKQEKVAGKHVVFIGAGGAAKALIYEATARGAKVTVLNRTAEKAISLASKFGAKGGGFDLFPALCKEGYDVIVNCIPQGEIIQGEWILPRTIAMDIVYVPKMTEFLKKAAQKNCRLVFGVEMFIQQALEQQRIWFGSKINMSQAEKIITKICNAS